MRALFTVTLVGAAFSAGCGGETCSDGTAPVNNECPCETGGYPSDFADNSCPTGCDAPLTANDFGDCVFVCDDGTEAPTADDCPFYFQPAAVAFEYLGGWDGTAPAAWASADGAFFPIIQLTFADADYFGFDTVEAQAGHYCEAIGVVTDPVAADIPTKAIDGDSAGDSVGQIWSSVDMTFSIDADSWATSDLPCATMIDQDLWGMDAGDLLNDFTAIHLGMGTGPLTTYLTDAWQDDNGDWASTDIADLSVGFFSEYWALNDTDGDWSLQGWSTGFMFDATEIDDGAGNIAYQPVEDADGLLSITDITTATALPTGYVQSSAFWYQDFPLLDLGNLGAAPVR